MPTNLVALAGWSAGLAGLWAWRGVGHQVRVRRTLGALAAAVVDVVPRWARHTGRAGGLAAEGTCPAPRGHPVHGVGYCNGEDSRHVVDPLAYLREGRRETMNRRVNPLRMHRCITQNVILPSFETAMILFGHNYNLINAHFWGLILILQ